MQSPKTRDRRAQIGLTLSMSLLQRLDDERLRTNTPISRIIEQVLADYYARQEQPQQPQDAPQEAHERAF